jgi:predicted Zn-dependent protease
MKQRIVWILAILVIASGAVATGCGGALVSNEQERQIGADVSQQVAAEYRTVAEGDPVARWADQLVQAMVPASEEFRDPDEFGGYKVEVIAADDLVNAFAVPGGYLYFATGIILQADTCAELAGVVGHEIAHVTERHSAEKLSQSAVASSLATVVLGEGLPSQIAQATWSFLQSTTFSRQDEKEADEVGTQILYETGYNPYALAEMFRKLGESGGPRPPEFLSSHPDPDNRVEAIHDLIQNKYGSRVRPNETQTYDCIGTRLTLEQVKERIRNGQLQLDPPTESPSEDGAASQ